MHYLTDNYEIFGYKNAVEEFPCPHRPMLLWVISLHTIGDGNVQ